MRFLIRRLFSLHTGLVLAFVLPVMMTAFATAYVLAGQDGSRDVRGPQDGATRVVDLDSRPQALPLSNADREIPLVEMAVANPDVASADNVKHLRCADISMARAIQVGYRMPDAAAKESIGDARVVVTGSAVWQTVNRARSIILAAILALVTLVCAVNFLLVKRLVLNPLRRIEAAVHKMSGGDPHARCTVESRDESGPLAMGVNAMAGHVCEANARLCDSEDRYRRIVENAPEGIFRLDERGLIDEANPAMARLLGYASATELILSVANDPNQRPFSGTQIRTLFDVLRTRGEIAGLDLQLSRTDGTPIWVLLNARAARVEGSDRVWLEGLLTDVTARKYAFEKLKKHRNQLALELRQRKRSELHSRTSREQLQQLSAHLEGLREDERKRIAMEIHDELGQLLTALKIDVSLLWKQLTPDSAVVHKLEKMRELVERTIQIIRSLVNHLRPAALNFGLVSALEWLVTDFTSRTLIICQFRSTGPEPMLSDSRATVMFRIVQESLTNVARHAGASRVDVSLLNSDASIELVITDNGRGFNPEAAQEGHSYGLLCMAERARMIDAHLQIDSQPGNGSTVRLRVLEDAFTANDT